MAADTSPDYNLPEIKTRSIERTLLPLIKQISTLVSHRSERCGLGSGGGRAVARVGQAVNLAVERFVTVGETIADDNLDIKQDMYDACKEARAAGGSIERLCVTASAMASSVPCPGATSSTPDSNERAAMVRAARGLLASVTRVLLLADIVVVKQLLLTKDKVARSLGRLESVSNFTEFVKAFSVFGAEMVELAHVTGERQNDLKDERRRAQMAAARQVLERSTMMLLTSSKACLRHPECPSSRENRDTVFCQMRRAMDLIHYVVKDGVLDCQAALSPRTQGWECEEAMGGSAGSDRVERGTVMGALRRLGQLVGRARATHAGPTQRAQLARALDQLIERTHDFTDSAYTGHSCRQNILLLCDRTKLELNQLLRVAVNMDDALHDGVAVYCHEMESELEASCAGALEALRALWAALVAAARAQAAELGTATNGAAKHAAELRHRLHPHADLLIEHIDHILEVCKLLRHIALSETLQVTAKFTEINLRIYGPQVVTAAKTLSLYPNSKIAKENLEVFVDMWQWLLSDVTAVAKDILELAQGKPEKQVYMSLPRPGKHGTTSKPLKAVRLDSEEQAKIAKSGLEMKMMSSEMDAETDKWQESGSALEENNDIVKRAKNMSSMAFAMYQFTKGEGQLKTTQDLFTQAEYFAEEANRLYKVVRQFSYQVPAGSSKKLLLEHLDKVPTYVQQLQFTVKDPTVGRAATFSKVDNVIQETKNLMNIISKVVTTCFHCANKYKLDFSGLSGRGGSGSGSGGREEEGGSGGGGDSKGGGSGPDTSM